MKRLSCRLVSDFPYRICSYVLYSDASATGCGTHLDINGEQVCNKQWDLEVCRRSSTWRELSAILFALPSFFTLLVGSSVKWFSDSQSSCKIIQVGSMRNELHAMDLFSLYILFSHFRPCDVTLGNSFFQMSSYARAYVCITHEKTKGKFPWEHHVV